MKYNEFLSRVQQEAELNSPEEAETIARATLETLGERVSRTDRHNLGAQLPNEIKEILFKRDPGEKYTLEEFYSRIAARTGLRFKKAVHQTRAVGDVLREAVSEGELKYILRDLPDDYAEIFGKPPEDPGSPSAV